MMATQTASNSKSQGDNKQVRVMIVDDSRVIRSILSSRLSEVAGISVIASCPDGRSAVEDIDRVQPDVVVLDIEMPEMDGLTALPIILRRRPDVRVLIVSTLTTRGAAISLEALTLGAADYIAKPEIGLTQDCEEFLNELTSKIRLLGKSRSLRNPAAPRQKKRKDPAVMDSARLHQFRDGILHPRGTTRDTGRLRRIAWRPSVVVIASSTGGPQALMRVFEDLGPAMGSMPILVAQHMPPTFTAILAEHVGRVAARPASEGSDGEVVLPGHVKVAPGGRHMILVQDAYGVKIRLTDDPPVNFCRPSADILFGSAIKCFGQAVLGVVLTGMGSDGADGCKKIIDAGGWVIAQDEATSVVWGMPRAVVQNKAASEVLPLDRIGTRAAAIIHGRT